MSQQLPHVPGMTGLIEFVTNDLTDQWRGPDAGFQTISHRTAVQNIIELLALSPGGVKMRSRGPEPGRYEAVKRNTSLPPRRTGVAGIRGAGFRLRPAVWWPVFASLIPSVEPHWKSAFTAGTNWNGARVSHPQQPGLPNGRTKFLSSWSC